MNLSMKIFSMKNSEQKYEKVKNAIIVHHSVLVANQISHKIKVNQFD